MDASSGIRNATFPVEALTGPAPPDAAEPEDIAEPLGMAELLGMAAPEDMAELLGMAAPEDIAELLGLAAPEDMAELLGVAEPAPPGTLPAAVVTAAAALLLELLVLEPAAVLLLEQAARLSTTMAAAMETVTLFLTVDLINTPSFGEKNRLVAPTRWVGVMASGPYADGDHRPGSDSAYLRVPVHRRAVRGLSVGDVRASFQVHIE